MANGKLTTASKDMAPLKRRAPENTGAHMGNQPPARCIKIAEKGIRTDRDFAALMSSLMTDLVSGRVPPNVGNAMCNAGGKLLRVVELTQRYGTRGTGREKRLQLART